MKKFNFENGIINRLFPILIKMESGVIFRQKSPHIEEVDLFERRIKQEVVVSWCSNSTLPNKFRAEYYVDSTAIEPVGYWKRNSKYKRIHFKDTKSLPFVAEDSIINIINRNGVRAEKATDFEDEQLGVDFWIFLKSNGLWKWFPIDVTLRKDVDVHHGKKFNKGFDAGVVTVRIDPGFLQNRSIVLFDHFFSDFKAGIENFEFCGKDFLSRKEAKAREEQHSLVIGK